MPRYRRSPSRPEQLEVSSSPKQTLGRSTPKPVPTSCGTRPPPAHQPVDSALDRRSRLRADTGESRAENCRCDSCSANSRRPDNWPFCPALRSTDAVRRPSARLFSESWYHRPPRLLKPEKQTRFAAPSLARSVPTPTDSDLRTAVESAHWLPASASRSRPRFCAPHRAAGRGRRRRPSTAVRSVPGESASLPNTFSAVVDIAPFVSPSCCQSRCFFISRQASNGVVLGACRNLYMSIEQNDKIGFTERARRNQKVRRAALQPQYDFLVCGSGSSGSVLARRLAESGEASVLLLEAGGTDDLPAVLGPTSGPRILEA